MFAHNFPAQTTPFIGRSDELAEITSLLNDPNCRLLTLVGAGGIGKTRLALEVAASQRSNYRDGVWFVPLQPIGSPELIVSAIADALYFQFFGQTDPKQQLFSYLHAKSILLVLDNCEHLLDGIALVGDILATAPNVKVLTTSRERLNLREEWIYDLGGLSYPTSDAENIEPYSAVQLFIQSASRVQSVFTLNDGNSVAVTQICQLVGGSPLGIELASAWVRVLPCETIAAEIERGLDILETQLRNVEPRHRSMRAAFEYSWNLLSETEREVFKKLSVFRGGFTHEAANHVAGASLRALSVLVDKSMLRVNASGRYDLHELLRQFAEEQLRVSSGMDAIRDAHNAYYTAFLEHQWHHLKTHMQVQALDQIEIEFENVRTAWQTMVEKQKAAEFTMSVYSIWLYADLRGRYPEALALFKQAEDALLPMAGDKTVDRAIGQMLTLRGWFYASLGRLDEGHTLAQQGLTILRQLGNEEDVALAFHSLCCIASFNTDGILLKTYAQESTEIARHMNDDWWLARALFSLANAALALNDLDEAQQRGQEFFDLAAACGDLWLKAMSLSILIQVAKRQSEYIQAKRFSQQSIKLLEEIGQVCTIGASYYELGDIVFWMDEFAETAYYYQQSLKILADHGGYTYYLLNALLFVADLWKAQNKREETVRLLTLILHHPETLHNVRDDAEQRLIRLQSELPSDTFVTAQRLGKSLDLHTMVAKLITELGYIAEKPPPVGTSNALQANPLTVREQQVISLVAQGLSNRAIARELVISLGTVKTHIHNICHKLSARSRTQAITRAHELNLM